jgi:hypothetical protein
MSDKEDEKEEEGEEIEVVVPEAPPSDGDYKEEEKEEIQDPSPAGAEEKQMGKKNAVLIAENKAAPPKSNPPDPEPKAAVASPPAAAPAPAPAPPPAPAAPPAGARRKIILMFVCLLVVVIILQAVIIGLFVDRNKDEENSNGDADRGVGGGDESIETPSPGPTGTPTPSPTLGTALFASIANAPEARRLASVSDCDNCNEFIPLPLQFVFQESKDPMIGALVSSNGSVNLTCGVIGKETCATIDVVATDLNPGWNGDIYTLAKSSSAFSASRQEAIYDTLVISWESVQVFGDERRREQQQEETEDHDDRDESNTVNAQVTLYGTTGVVEICWGNGDVKGNSFRSGILDVENSIYYPAQGPKFGASGFSDEFPNNTCQRFFEGDDIGVTIGPNSPQVPTDTPTSYASPSTGFVSIANKFGANRLPNVSECDDCTESVALPFFHMWSIDAYPISSLEVSSNGRIFVNDCGLEGQTCGIINVISTDLDPGLTESGGVWTFDAFLYSDDVGFDETNNANADSSDFHFGAFIISWENVPICCRDELLVVNAQVHIYPNGRIDMCWGAGEDEITFTSSIQDLIDGIFLPATGALFDGTGQTLGSYPSYTCQTFFGE